MVNQPIIRIAVSGVGGQMCHSIIQATAQSDKVMLSAALTHSGSKYCGADSGEIAGVGYLGVIINETLEEIQSDFDILVDFTCPEASLAYLSWCREHSVSMVIGTTGFSEKQKLEIRTASRDIGIVFSSNFSIGVNLMLRLLEKSAQVIGQESDIEIIEAHHRYKVDAPSGTALSMGDTIAKTLNQSLTDCAVYGYERQTGKKRKKKNTIGFSTIRAGSIVGEHTTLFATINERLEITHRACNRMAFANGAIRAVSWLYDQKKSGLFNMIDVLNLKKL